MIDTVLIEAVGALGLAAAAFAARRQRTPRRPPPPSIGRLVRALPRRHRKVARAIVELAREHDARHPKGSLESFTARETLATYLPETIGAYLSVPRSMRKTRPPGRLSPDEELRRQLATLHAGVTRLAEADAEIAAGRMAENGAFLRERFGPAPLEPAPPTPGSILSDVASVLGSYLRRD